MYFIEYRAHWARALRLVELNYSSCIHSNPSGITVIEFFSPTSRGPLPHMVNWEHFRFHEDKLNKIVSASGRNKREIEKMDMNEGSKWTSLKNNFDAIIILTALSSRLQLNADSFLSFSMLTDRCLLVTFYCLLLNCYSSTRNLFAKSEILAPITISFRFFIIYDTINNHIQI